MCGKEPPFRTAPVRHAGFYGLLSGGWLVARRVTLGQIQTRRRSSPALAANSVSPCEAADEFCGGSCGAVCCPFLEQIVGLKASNRDGGFDSED